jgi:hypothetical protein
MAVDEINVIPTAAVEDSPEVYLCQVGEKVSCGACCGLYNVADLSRDALEARLVHRTERFTAVPRTEEGIEKFRRDIEGWTPEDRPFPQFHHCPFLGMIGAGSNRVGCLLHPDVPGNNGRDLRFLSYYGAKACRSYFCPTTQSLPTRYLTILRGLWDDWYPYGLIITEHRLLNALFTTLESRIARPLGPDDFPIHSEASRCLRELVGVKLAWPYRCNDAPGPRHFVFENGLYPRAEIHWPSTIRPDWPCETIFKELESCFVTEKDLLQADKLLRDLFSGICDALD